MTENKAIMETLLAADRKEEATNVLDFTKTLTTEQNKELEALLRGVKTGLNLATGGIAKTA